MLGPFRLRVYSSNILSSEIHHPIRRQRFARVRDGPLVVSPVPLSGPWLLLDILDSKETLNQQE